MVLGRDQRGGILCAGPDVVQWRVSVNGFELFRVVRRAVIGGPGPADGELVKAQHVHDADRRQRRAKQIGALIQRRADQ